MVGDRGVEAFWNLWDAVPGSPTEKVAHGYATDEWLADEVILEERRTTLNGRTNHVERLFCTLRERLARLMRRSLAFSKSEVMHRAALLVFFDLYNQSR